MLIRIAVLTNSYPPRHRGGAARIAARQVEMLERAGFEVRVWSPQVPWFSAPAWQRFFYHLRDLGADQKLVQDILTWQPDVLITHNLTGCGFGTPAVIQKRGVRWVHVLHDIQLFEPSGQLYSLSPVTFWQLFWAALREQVFKRPNIAMSPTRWLLEQHRYRFLFKGLDVRCELLPNPGPATMACSRGQFHEPVRLLFVGHVSPAKGSALLIELVKKLRLPFELHVVGDGPDLAALQASSPQVVTHGFCETKAVLEHMQNADLLLVPSLIHENQPTVILEAAAVSLPVVAAHRGGIVETLGMAAAHMICPPRRVESWCQAIERLRPPHVYQHHVHLMQHVAEAHDAEAYAQRFISLVTSNR